MCSTTTHSTSNDATINTLGIHHLGLSVPDIKETAAFFIEQLNFSQVGEQPEYPAIFISDGTVMLTLWQIKDVGNMTAFNRHDNVGLHHFALKIANLEELQSLHQQLAVLDNVAIEFAPEQLEGFPFHHMMCLIPGGVRLELIC
jgi:catechol-2,3-dioxygenase